METLFNVSWMMIEIAEAATGRGDELGRAYVMATLIISLVFIIALLRWAVQFTVKLVKK